MSNVHAVGLLIQDRIKLTKETLFSLTFSNQDKDTYDLYVIDNGSSEDSYQEIRDWISSYRVPCQNIVRFGSQQSIPEAWNLFLYLTQDYKFRTKIDNDIIFAGTRTPTVVREGVKKMKKKKRLQKEMEESIGGGPDGPGYNMPREPSRAGSGFTKRTYKPVPFRRGTEFLYHLVDFHRESGADMVSLVPLSPENSFIDEHKKACTNLFMDAPYLRGGCVMITKAGFDKCGYYNEKIERMGDLDYSRRIMKAGLNIGYHPRYWVQHNGHELYTEGPNLASTRQQMARHYMENTPTVINMGTKWEKKGKAILAAAAKTDIVNIE